VRGTDAEPVPGADAVRVVGLTWTNTDHDFHFPNTREDVNSGTLLPPPPGTPEGEIVTFRLTVEFKGVTTAISASNKPESGPAWRASAYSETLDLTGGSETVTYAPASSGHESATVYIYQAGTLWKLVGGVCGTTIVAAAGNILRIEQEWSAQLLTITAAAVPGGLVFDDTEAPNVVDSGLTVGAWSPDFQEFRLRTNPTLQLLESGNAADGLLGYFISKHNPEIENQGLVDALGTYDPYADRRAGTARDIDVQWGSTQYAMPEIQATGCIPTAIRHADHNTFTAYTVTYRVAGLSVIVS
jgi:hypothetical protein